MTRPSIVALAAPVAEGRADMVVGDRLSSTYFKENRRALARGRESVRSLAHQHHL